jgi:hypothetical protein
MRLRDIVITEGVLDGFKKGYAKAGGKELDTDWKPEKSVQKTSSTQESPFNILSNSEAKEILRSVIDKQPLDSMQIVKLQRIYNSL